MRFRHRTEHNIAKCELATIQLSSESFLIGYLITLAFSCVPPSLCAEPVVALSAAVLVISATRSLGNAPLAPAFLRASISTWRARSFISAWLAPSLLETLWAAPGDLLPLLSDFPSPSPVAGDLFLLGEDSALEVAAGLSLLPMAALSVDSPLLHSSKEGIRGGRLGGGGAALFGPFLAGEVWGLVSSPAPGAVGFVARRRLCKTGQNRNCLQERSQHVISCRSLIF